MFLPQELRELYEKAKNMKPEDESPRLEGIQYATGEKQRAIASSSRKNEAAEPKWK